MPNNMQKANRKVAIIGGGIVGLATAYRLSQAEPSLSITIIEKEAALGAHQTGNNSGVLHAGLYYKPGSAKAKLAVKGIRQMIEFCQAHHVPYEICGKLVVAASEEELPRLHALFERGQINGLADLQLLNQAQLKEIEPYVSGVAGIRVPEEGIVDYKQVCVTLADILKSRGVEVVTSAKATQLMDTPYRWTIVTSAGNFEADFLINCAGLYCDCISELAGEKRDIRIVPFRGEYYKIKPERQYLVNNLIYPVPHPKFPFLGVHFTRLIHGGIEAGPNAVLALAREGYRKSQINLGELQDVLSYTGFWRFLAQHWQVSLGEVARSLSKPLFCQSLQRLVPDIREADLETGGAGVRAQAISPTGQLVQDFQFIIRRNALHVLNTPSPAATASLAIGEEVVRYLQQHW